MAVSEMWADRPETQQQHQMTQPDKTTNDALVSETSRDSDQRSCVGATVAAVDVQLAGLRLYTLVAAAVVVPFSFVWSYWPALMLMVETWDREPDYSHGYFVIPLAIFFLWVRRDSFPGWSPGLYWAGLIPIVASILFRAAGAFAYVDAVDGWSILVWVAGIVWLFFGWKVLRWALPSVAFLWFMIPLPFRLEQALSLPLQGFATKLSCWALQFLGQPALAEGNTILLGDARLEVAQACSGLRIFVGIFALAYAYVVLVRRSWWIKGMLLASVIPIALIANSTRIVVTGLLNQYISGEAAHEFTHDMSGWIMIPFAALLFAIVLWYLGKLIREVDQLDVGKIIRRESI